MKCFNIPLNYAVSRTGPGIFTDYKFNMVEEFQLCPSFSCWSGSSEAMYITGTHVALRVSTNYTLPTILTSPQAGVVQTNFHIFPV